MVLCVKSSTEMMQWNAKLLKILRIIDFKVMSPAWSATLGFNTSLLGGGDGQSHVLLTCEWKGMKCTDLNDLAEVWW